MKRYSLGVDWNSAGRPKPCAKEMSAGRFILFADHAARCAEAETKAAISQITAETEEIIGGN